MVDQQQDESRLKKVVVRPAVASDAAWCVGQLKAFSKTYGTKRSLFSSDEYAMQAFTKVIEDHLVYVAVKGDELLGFISGYVLPHVYNPEIKTLTESFWWVEPKHRGSRAGYLLFKAFMEYGKEQCDWVITTIEDISPVSEAFYLRQGFKLKEKSYILEVH